MQACVPSRAIAAAHLVYKYHRAGWMYIVGRCSPEACLQAVLHVIMQALPERTAGRSVMYHLAGCPVPAAARRLGAPADWLWHIASYITYLSLAAQTHNAQFNTQISFAGEKHMGKIFNSMDGFETFES